MQSEAHCARMHQRSEAEEDHVTGSASQPSETRVPLTEAHRRNTVDPLTALLIPAAAGGEPTRSACERTLPIFDGHRRYDLKLAFKRMDQVKADRRSTGGPVVVCSVAFEPIAGHRTDSKLVKFLAHDREIELWLAPIAGTRLLARCGCRLPTCLAISSCRRPNSALQARVAALDRATRVD